MQPRGLKIWHKLALAQLLPLSFLIILSLVQYFVTLETAVVLRKEEHGRRVMVCLNTIRRFVEEGITDLANMKRYRKEPARQKTVIDHYESLLTLIPIELEKLKKVVRPVPEEYQVALDIERRATEAVKVLSECKENFLQENQFVAFSDMPMLFRAGEKVKEDVDKLAKHYEKLNNSRYSAEKNLVDTSLLLAIITFILGTVIAGVVIVWLSRDIVRRVSALSRNTELLAKGEDLAPRTDKEYDELSMLDLFFRNMSQELKNAQEVQKALTQAALASEERTRMVIENMPIGILIIDQDNKIESLNPRAEQMFQLSKSSAAQQPLSKLLPESPSLKSTKSTDEFRRGNLSPAMLNAPSKVSGDSMAMRSDGDSFPAEIAVSKYSTDEGKHMLVTVQDVTERHEMERLKREFVSMVSHDLRTPLTAVQGTLDLLEEDTYGDLTDQGHKRVRTASESVDRLINLINDLLDIEKMEAGKMRLEPKVVALSAILEHSVESVRTFAENAEVSLSWDSSTDYDVQVDKDRVIQVVVNLLSNSVKFSPKGATVSIVAKPDNEMIRVEVIDHGRGIPKEYVGSLFERFKQVKAADGARKKGTGLGLAICKAIIESHGGQIGVTSEEGKGSVFFFTIPLALKEASA